MTDKIMRLYEMVYCARTGPTRPPLRLSSWIVSIGGLRDYQGEVSALIGKANRRPGLINNRSGMHLDHAAQIAWEAGYIVPAIGWIGKAPFPPGWSDERPTPADFLNALDECLNCSPVYAADDWQTVEHYEAAEAARNKLDSLGILPPNKRKAIAVEQYLAEITGAAL